MADPPSGVPLDRGPVIDPPDAPVPALRANSGSRSGSRLNIRARSTAARTISRSSSRWTAFGSSRSRREARLSGPEAEDLLQETFLALHNHILEHGFPDNLPAMLQVLTEGQLLNHLHAQRRASVSLGLPSSGLEKPRSGPDVERTLARWELAQRLVDQLSPEHQSVIDKVLLRGVAGADERDLAPVPRAERGGAPGAARALDFAACGQSGRVGGV
jgi:DNA-directed RNA polymerase specialized sigma24 family protein